MDSTQNILTFGSLFSGAGGLDLGLERAGLQCTFQVENDKHCLTILNRHWPNVPKNEIRPCMGLVGGDPCPIRSSLAKIHGPKSADMSGYFLAMAKRIGARWILRENICAPDVGDFQAGLEVLGYFSIVIRMDSKVFTGQSRKRQFMVAFNTKQQLDKFSLLVHQAINKEPYEASPQIIPPASCLNTKGRRTPTYCNDLIYGGPGKGLRGFTSTERESLQGWPPGWTDGVPHSARERMTGNGVTSDVGEYIGNIIKQTLTEQAEILC